MKHIIFLSGIWPNGAMSTQFTRPIASYQLKHWLSHFGINSQVIEFCQLLSSEEIIDLLDHFVGPETFAIGLSTTFWNLLQNIPKNMAETVAGIRARWPHIKIITGGPRTPTKLTTFDYYIVGDAEDKLLSWCQSQMKGYSLPNRLFNITELAHRFDSNDCIMPGETLPIELGRGCIFKCKFCSHVNLGKPKFTYQRQFDKTLDEISYNKENFGTTRYILLDDTVNEDLDKIRNLATIKDRLGFEIEWTGYLRADLVWSKSESAELLKQSGLRSCFFGVETFNPRAGRSIDKGWASKHGKDYIPKLHNDIWDSKINIHLNFIAGLPYEDINSLRDTLDWCKTQDIGYHRFVPLTLYVEKKDEFASSEFTRNYAANGYKNVNEDTGYWEHDYMNLNDARKFCRISQDELSPINRMSCWDAFGAANLGFELDDVFKWSYFQFLTNISTRRDSFKQEYIAKLKSVKT